MACLHLSKSPKAGPSKVIKKLMKVVANHFKDNFVIGLLTSSPRNRFKKYCRIMFQVYLLSFPSAIGKLTVVTIIIVKCMKG